MKIVALVLSVLYVERVTSVYEHENYFWNACPFLLHRLASLHSNRKLTSSCLYFWPCLLSGRTYPSHGIHIRTIQNGWLQEEMHMRRCTFFASLNAWKFSKTSVVFLYQLQPFGASFPRNSWIEGILHFHFDVISSSRLLNHSYRLSGTVNIKNKINLTSDSCWVIVTNVGCQFKSILFSLIPFLLKCTHRYKPVHYKTVRVLSILSAILNALQWKVC